MSRWPLLLPLAVMCAAPGEAWALKPSKHRALAETACARAQLPDAFCRRMGKQVYETDYLEWDTLAAHAQRENGQDRCSAADASVARVGRLARATVEAARLGRLEDAAIALGGALHTIQDECAHHGMTNQEHAFYSLETQCGSMDVSPDTQPAAIACADARTTQVMNLAATALAGTRWGYVSSLCVETTGEQDRDKCAAASLPTPFMACDFLAEHEDWDGDDSSWDPTLVGDALVASFGAGLTGEQATRSVCAGNPTAIDPVRPKAHVTENATSCMSVGLLCGGKVDDAGQGEPETASGGCSTGAPAGFAMLLLALIPALRRRRR